MGGRGWGDLTGDHPGDSRLADDLPATLSDPLTLLQGLRLVFPGQRLRPPDVRVVLVLVAEDDGAVPHVAHVDLAPSDEGDAGGGPGSAGQPAGSLGPLLCKQYLHSLRDPGEISIINEASLFSNPSNTFV